MLTKNSNSLQNFLKNSFKSESYKQIPQNMSEC